MSSAARTEAACFKNIAAHPFDWAAHNRAMDERMAAVNQSIAHDAEIGRKIVAATHDMVNDVRAMIGGAK
ncbi:hypothetical protein [Novosphingobium sp.]|uniref:hypothetical protein n=1 Tax=Novosphingobium sp. TaxID=1874826 RepID=UPI00286DFDF3|nr:hypothetical protein [Novosphingobium sp.]